ncbi:RagB/SusD family nutrient uptake outer membrane protein [Bernardetia sp. ABR2-2B]|uniref:RagB/SusD family nutrient uptake outer membrane protein n=1 Tax=Bernardetia sp. ABR2-2B TaxID=3127472 RepID=UPI0030CD7E68
MTIRKYITAAALAATLLATTSCDDFLNVEPEQSLNDDQVFSSLDAANAAILGMYDRMQTLNYYGRDIIVIPDLMADNTLITSANSGRYVDYYSYNVVAQTGTIRDLYTRAYQTIKAANNILANIDNLEASGAENEALRNSIKGEALFGRALSHFNLVRLIGRPYTDGNGANLGVPVVLGAEDEFNGRATVAEVYAQVIADLEEAAPLMSYSTPFRISDQAAYALLSRVYLYKGDNQQAIDAANQVDGFDLLQGQAYVDSWAASGSSEEIFTLRFAADENRGADNLGDIFIPSGYGDIRPTNDLIDVYSAGDVRLGFIRPDDGDDYNFKFGGENAISGLSSPRVIRYAEVLLNRAEAQAKLGNLSAALADVNSIRSARGADALGSITVDEVLEERRRELAFEGHRLFDLTRNGLGVTRIENTNLGGAPSVIDFNDPKIILPIPERERDANPGVLEQNPGY